MSNIAFIGSPLLQIFNPNTGTFNSLGSVGTYVAGSPNTPLATYPTTTDCQNQTNTNQNPVQLNGAGSPVNNVGNPISIVCSTPIKIVVYDASGNSLFTVDNYNANTVNIYDANGNALILFSGQANAVNQLTISNAVTGSNPQITATGSDSNVGITFNIKGSGVFNFVGPLASSNLSDISGNKYITWTTVTTPVNYINISNAATGVNPSIGVAGSDTNIGLLLKGQGNLGAYNQGAISGTTAPAGYVGEVQSNTASGTFLSSGSPHDACLLSNLSPGNWLIFGNIYMSDSGGTISGATASISTSTDTPNNNLMNSATFSGASGGLTTPLGIVKITSTTTYHLVCTLVYTGTLTVSSFINAIRLP